MLDKQYQNIAQKILRRTGKVLYMLVSLLERVLRFLLEKTKKYLGKSFDEEKKMKTNVDNFLDKARDILESDLLKTKHMKFELDTYVNKKLDEIIFFRSLLDDFNFPKKKTEQLKNIESEIFNQLLAYSEFQKGNTKAEVALIGAFSSGKSTIINSFLKEEVCPSNPNPTTSSVTKFYFSNKKTIRLDGKNISPQDYTNKVRHKNLGKDTKVYFFEYGHNADIFNSIVLYDTPGFGNAANKNDDKVTKDILEDVDVVIYTIDINKGSLDKEDVKRLKELKKHQNKKFYCIMNKADGKTPKAIEKIKKEIERYNIFDIVIAYSAKNVLNASIHFSIEHFFELTKKKIYNKKIFESTIKSEQYMGRRNKNFYHLMLDEQEIDEDGIDAIIQRDKLEKIFNNISMKKHHILANSFKENEKRYKLKARNILKDILSEIDTYDNQNDNLNFINKTDSIFQKIIEVERLRSKAIYIIIVDAYKKSLSIESRVESGIIFDDYYYWVNFNKSIFYNNLDGLKEIYEEIIEISKNLFEEVEKDYCITVEFPMLSNKYLFKHAIEILQQSNSYEQLQSMSDYSDIRLKSIGIMSPLGRIMMQQFNFDDQLQSAFDGGIISHEYKSKDEAESIMNKYKKYAENIISEDLDSYRLANDIKNINLKIIENKSGMFRQNLDMKEKSKLAIKNKIQDYLNKGEKNV